jgi:hypothetical protein
MMTREEMKPCVTGFESERLMQQPYAPHASWASTLRSGTLNSTHSRMTERKQFRQIILGVRKYPGSHKWWSPSQIGKHSSVRLLGHKLPRRLDRRDRVEMAFHTVFRISDTPGDLR